VQNGAGEAPDGRKLAVDVQRVLVSVQPVQCRLVWLTLLLYDNIRIPFCNQQMSVVIIIDTLILSVVICICIIYVIIHL
jgi:hypothetical protein